MKQEQVPTKLYLFECDRAVQAGQFIRDGIEPLCPAPIALQMGDIVWVESLPNGHLTRFSVVTIIRNGLRIWPRGKCDE